MNPYSNAFLCVWPVVMGHDVIFFMGPKILGRALLALLPNEPRDTAAATARHSGFFTGETTAHSLLH